MVRKLESDILDFNTICKVHFWFRLEFGSFLGSGIFHEDPKFQDCFQIFWVFLHTLVARAGTGRQLESDILDVNTIFKVTLGRFEDIKKVFSKSSLGERF